MPAPGSAWWSRAIGRASARWPTSAASGSGSWPARWPSRRRTTRSPGSRSREELLDGFAAATLDAAFLDADFAAWYLHEHPKLAAAARRRDYVPRERWNMALAVRAKDAELLVEINRALAQLAESGELRKIYAEYGVPFHAPVHGGRPHGRGASRYLARGSATGASWSSAWTRPTCPIRPPGTTARVRRRAGAGPGRAAARQASDRMARRPARDRGGRAPRGRVRPGPSARPSIPTPSPTTRSWRARSSTRGPTTARAMCSSGARTARASVAGGAEGRAVAAPGYRGRLGRRLPPPPAGLSPPPVPQPARHAQGPERRRHRLRLPLGQRRLDPARLARLRGSWSSSPASCRRTTGISRSPCAGETTSSSDTSTRRSAP